MARDDLSELLTLGFREVDEFLLVDAGDDLTVDTAGRLNGVRTAATGPSVYAWVACRPAGSEVFYVGMASSGWLVRRGQHFQGLRLRVGAGGKNRLGIVQEIGSKARVKVLEKPAEAESYFGIRAPTHGAEEWALLARFAPKLNRLSDVRRAKAFAEI